MMTIFKFKQYKNSKIANLMCTVLRENSNALTLMQWFFSQTALVCFVVYTLAGNTLTPDIAFVSISLFGLLSAPIIIIPMAIMNLVQVGNLV